MKNKELLKFVVQTLLAVLSAIATALGVSSCLV
ncbi:MAG: smalltalk protein [Prevotella sp.]|nr:smalltalk protein [Prevotella sp.]